MLLLYLSGLLEMLYIHHYLHSIMLLLYRMFPPISLVCHSNLHSIMLLLYLYPSVKDNDGMPQFTFHYASTLSCPGRSPPVGDVIYIPLCFYFISDRTSYVIRSTLFTFHYASTLSETNGAELVVTVKFTFHYASTLSCRLHSNRRGNDIFTFHYASTLSAKKLNF